MKARSIKGQTPEEIRNALQQAMAEGFKPTLAFVFISIHNNRDAVTAILDQHNIQIFGATTGGEFIDGDIGSGGIAILLLEINPQYFTILFHDYRDNDLIAVAKEMAALAKAKYEHPSFILSASMNILEVAELQLGDPLIKAIESVTGPDTIIWGGRAGDDFAYQETEVFTNHVCTKRGIIMLVFDGEHILVRGEAASGLKPVGTEKTITKAIDNWIYELDGQPAADLVLKYLGINMTREEAETYFPKDGIMLSVSREKGDPVIRGVGMFNLKDNSFSSLGNIRVGDKIRLTLPPDFELIEEVGNNAVKVQREIDDAGALVMFSCVGRLSQFGPLIGDEIEAVRKAFNVPMAGFFTYGEFGRTRNGNNEFHAGTCCWVALKEK
jgi:hypothetical protein